MGELPAARAHISMEQRHHNMLETAIGK